VVSGGCLISGSSVRRSLLFSNVRVHSYSAIEDSVLLPEVVVNRHCVLKRCVVDKSCVLPEGLRVGFDPDEDRKRFYVSERGITLITPEMLGQKVFHQR
jgi:glucose-1-phosphate adenylyltransferase